MDLSSEMPEQTDGVTTAMTISEPEFIKLCDDIYADRQQIYQFNPHATKREALLWMMLGCLISLLSVPTAEQENAADESSADPYFDAICRILRTRVKPAFNPQTHLARLLRQIERE